MRQHGAEYGRGAGSFCPRTRAGIGPEPRLSTLVPPSGRLLPSTLYSLLLLLLRGPDLGPCLILVQNTNHVGQIHAFVNQHLLITN